MKKITLFSAFLIVMLLAACSGQESNLPTATPIDVSALSTAAVQTIVADITKTAVAMPTLEIPTETSTPVAATPTETVTPTAAVSPTPALCDNSAFVKDVSVLDGSQMTPGMAFVKTWKVKNVGTCIWSKGYQMIFAYGEKMGGLPTALDTEVLPGSEVEISIQLVASTKPGNYGGYWRLANNNGVAFGEIFTVLIVVP